MDSGYAEIFGAALQLTVTVLLACVAFYRETWADRLLERFRPRKLCVEWKPRPPYLDHPPYFDEETRDIHLTNVTRIEIRNDGSRDVENLQAFIEHLKEVRPDGSRQDVPGFVPGRLIWTHTNRSATVDFVPPGIARFLDIGSQIVGEGFILATEIDYDDCGLLARDGETTYEFRLTLAAKGGILYRALWSLVFDYQNARLEAPKSLIEGHNCSCTQ